VRYVEVRGLRRPCAGRDVEARGIEKARPPHARRRTGLAVAASRSHERYVQG